MKRHRAVQRQRASPTGFWKQVQPRPGTDAPCPPRLCSSLNVDLMPPGFTPVLRGALVGASTEKGCGCQQEAKAPVSRPLSPSLCPHSCPWWETASPWTLTRSEHPALTVVPPQTTRGGPLPRALAAAEMKVPRSVEMWHPGERVPTTESAWIQGPKQPWQGAPLLPYLARYVVNRANAAILNSTGCYFRKRVYLGSWVPQLISDTIKSQCWKIGNPSWGGGDEGGLRPLGLRLLEANVSSLLESQWDIGKLAILAVQLTHEAHRGEGKGLRHIRGRPQVCGCLEADLPQTSFLGQNALRVAEACGAEAQCFVQFQTHFQTALECHWPQLHLPPGIPFFRGENPPVLFPQGQNATWWAATHQGKGEVSECESELRSDVVGGMARRVTPHPHGRGGSTRQSCPQSTVAWPVSTEHCVMTLS